MPYKHEEKLDEGIIFAEVVPTKTGGMLLLSGTILGDQPPGILQDRNLAWKQWNV